MPTDHVKNRTFKETLSGTVRFKIPFFQRGYSWERETVGAAVSRHPGAANRGA